MGTRQVRPTMSRSNSCSGSAARSTRSRKGWQRATAAPPRCREEPERDATHPEPLGNLGNNIQIGYHKNMNFDDTHVLTQYRKLYLFQMV